MTINEPQKKGKTMSSSPTPIRRGRYELLDTPQAAEYLGVTVRLVRALVQERRITFVKVGRYVRFDLADLDNWIDNNRFEAVA